MIPNLNLSDARRPGIEPGGYVVRILAAEVDVRYNRLQLQIDIVEGPEAGYFTRLNEQFKFWGLTANLYLDEKSRWKFANAVDAIRASNADFRWEDDAENDERQMVNMYVGAICQRYHYIGNDGKEKTKLQVHHLVPVEEIRNGTFEIPEDSYAKDFPAHQMTPAPGGVVDTTADLPPGFYESADNPPFEA